MVFIYIKSLLREYSDNNVIEAQIWVQRDVIIASVSSKSKFSKILQPRENPILKTSNIFSEVVPSETSNSLSDISRYLHTEDCGKRHQSSPTLHVKQMYAIHFLGDNASTLVNTH